MENLYLSLWNAANVHCVCMSGEFLVEGFEATEDEPVPPCPSEPDVLKAVTEYLKETI